MGMSDWLSKLRPRRGRQFSVRLIASDPAGRPVVLTVGSRSIGLRWPDVAADEKIEILVDGVYAETHPFLTIPPAEITFAEIQRWGPNSPPNIRWRLRPSDAPDLPPERVLAVVTRDLDYRFVFADEETARAADAALTEAIEAAGYTLT